VHDRLGHDPLIDTHIASAPVSFGIWDESKPAPTNPENLLATIHTAGFKGIEVSPTKYFGRSAQDANDLLRKRHLRSAGTFLELPLFTSGDQTPQIVRDAVSYLERLDGNAALIVADAGDAERQADAGQPAKLNLSRRSKAQQRAAIDWLRRAAAQAGERGVEVLIHPHAGSYFESADEIAALLDHTSCDQLGICLDTGHAVLAGLDPVQLVRACQGRVRHVHLKDVDQNAMSRLARGEINYETAWKQGLWPPLGTGLIDLVAILQELRRSGYDGWLVLEQDRFEVHHSEYADVARIEANSLDVLKRALVITAGNEPKPTA
jgi:inosose dehydratase